MTAFLTVVVVADSVGAYIRRRENEGRERFGQQCAEKRGESSLVLHLLLLFGTVITFLGRDGSLHAAKMGDRTN